MSGQDITENTPLILGLDTGGTYTDAALVDATSRQVVATAKSLTTREDLAIGVGKAMAAVLDVYEGQTGAKAAPLVRLTSLSTTLATNAVVEGVGGRVALILIGFDDGALSRAGLAEAADPAVTFFVNGGHRGDGTQQSPLDKARLSQLIEETKGQVSAFAVAGHFATRNPAHEEETARMLQEATGLPVTCSTELSNALGGPKRALTTLLNGRLISLIERLIGASQAEMDRLNLTCPLMVVKGDGSLVSADFARTRPVETVLSGPAASLAGAAFLAGETTALVSDIGGTTTDIALLHDGVPMLSSDGARVGGWQTMVEAAHIRTSGLGGDSEVQPVRRGRDNALSGKRVTLGPRRAIPLSLLAQDWPEIHKHLDAQLAAPVAQASDGRFLIAMMPEGVPDWLSRSEKTLAAKMIEAGRAPLADIAPTQVLLGAADRLVARGLVMLSAFTPTDAAHLAGQFDGFDGQAAEKGGLLMARQKNALGESLSNAKEADGNTAISAEAKAAALEIAQTVLEELSVQSGLRLMDAALAEEGHGEGVFSANPILSGLLRTSKGASNADRGGESQGLTQITARLDKPLIALGASAATHYPAIAKRLDAKLIVPENADVAGAVGAAAGSVRQRVMITITQPQDGVFRVHGPGMPSDFAELDNAISAARQMAREQAEARARAAGGQEIEVSLRESLNEVELGGGKTLFIDAQIQAEAVGR